MTAARSRSRTRRVLLNGTGLLVALVALFPVYWMVLTSFRRGTDIQSPDPSFLPFPGTLANYRKVFEREYFWTAVRNSLMVTTITVALAAYFAGDIRALDGIAASPRGGPFQQRVWEALRAIPPGHPTTYRDFGITLGGERMARAVGMANATNPIVPIIPCHRLVGSNGSLTGYYWGLERKRWLLDHERRHA